MVPKNSNSFYINNSLNFENKGWIKAEDIKSSFFFYLYENTILEEVNKVSCIFKILNGIHKNKIVKIDFNYFGQRAYCKKYKERSSASLFVKDSFLYFLNTKVKLVEPLIIPKGSYNIIYPDRPRNTLPLNYFYSKNGSKFASTWFPISKTENIESIYLHLGTYSKGCLTVDYNSKINTKSWDILYLYLINSYLNKNVLGMINIY